MACDTDDATFSFELYPPRNAEAEAALCSASSTALVAAGPEFIWSPTGPTGRRAASRSTSCATCCTTRTVQPMAHLTCVGSSYAEAIAADPRVPGCGGHQLPRAARRSARRCRRGGRLPRRSGQRGRARAAHPPRADGAGAVHFSTTCPASPVPSGSRAASGHDRGRRVPERAPALALASRRTRHPARQAGGRREPRDHAAVLRRRRLPAFVDDGARGRRHHAHPAGHHAGAQRRRACSACSSSPARRPPLTCSRDLERAETPEAAAAVGIDHATSLARDLLDGGASGTPPLHLQPLRSPARRPRRRGSARHDEDPRMTHRYHARTFPTGTILGYPRIGRRRELKRAVEAFWKHDIGVDELEQTAADLRAATRERLASLGLGATDSSIPESFSLLRPGAGCGGHRRRDPRAVRRPRRRRRHARPRRLLHHRPRRGRQGPARDDEVVRLELPLPGARDRARHRVPPRQRPSGARGRRGEGRRVHARVR